MGRLSEPDTYDWDDDDKEVGGVQDDEKDDKVKGYEPVKEDEVDFVFKPTKMKKLKKKWNDGKGKELLKGGVEEDWLNKGSKKDESSLSRLLF